MKRRPAGPPARSVSPGQSLSYGRQTSRPPAARPLASTPPFAAATFLGAFLLFLVQPLIARYLLPWFGGGPGVWTTCMLFFQAVLLAGYAYAHLGTRLVEAGRISRRGQAAVHGLLLIAALAALPLVVPSPAWKPTASGDPTGQILLLLTVTVGLPYFVLSATGPLLQAWFSRTDPDANARRTYRLYALSNAGSLLALLGYPFVLEPVLGRSGQAMLWMGGLVAFVVICGVCAWIAAKKSSQHTEPKRSTPRLQEQEPPTLSHRILWLVLPACASVLLLATSNALTQDIAPVPLLWVLPLALYLLTFVFAFDRPGWYRRWAFAPLLTMAMGAACWLLFQTDDRSMPMILRVATLSGILFICCMVCHGELARLKPPTRQLTRYYLMIAAGGALGGVLVAVVAPLALGTYSELHMGLWTCAMLAVVTPAVADRRPPRGVPGLMVVAGLVVLAFVLWAAASRYMADAVLVQRSRDFFGVLSVYKAQPNDPANAHLLLHHGGVTHGRQFLADGRRMTPTTYYTADSGVGLALRDAPATGRGRRVGAVGLGAGTIAAYGRAGDVFRFYELSPSIVRLAHDPFAFLRDSPAKCEVVLGDGRLSLERELAARNFDVLVLDAFSGDAVPVHLLTVEAFDVYLKHVAPDGLLAVHISNNYLDLQPVLRRWAEHARWAAVLVTTARHDGPDGPYPSDWVLMSADSARLDRFRAAGAKPLTDNPAMQLWTDDRTDLLRLLKRSPAEENLKTKTLSHE